VTERRKRIIALSLLITMIYGISACKKKEIHLTMNKETNEEELSGNLYKEDLKYYYILESLSKNGNNRLSLVYDKYNNKELYAIYGEIISILPFNYFVKEYGEVKEVYSAKDIENILNKIEDNYHTIKNDDKVKKLELKGKK